MKRLLVLLTLALGTRLLYADSTIANLPTNSVSPNFKMVWANPGVANYAITYQNFTNQVASSLSGVALTKGTATLSSGTVTITTSSATTTSVIGLTYVSSTTSAMVMVSARNAGSFVIKSSNATDSNQVCWEIFNP